MMLMEMEEIKDVTLGIFGVTLTLNTSTWRHSDLEHVHICPIVLAVLAVLAEPKHRC